MRANVIYTCLLYLHCMLCIHSSACSCWLFFTSLSVYHFLLPVFLLFASLCFIYLARAFMFLGVPVQRFLHLSPLLNLNQLSSFHPIFFFFCLFATNACCKYPYFFPLKLNCKCKPRCLLLWVAIGLKDLAFGRQN